MIDNKKDLLVNILEGAMIALLTALPITAYFITPVKQVPRHKQNEDEVTVSCKQGLCYLQKQESSYIELVPVNQPRRAYIGDRTITVGNGTQLQIIFSDQSQIYQNDSTVLSVTRGRQDTLLTRESKDDEESQGGSASAANAAGDGEGSGSSKLLYIGNQYVEILHPLPNAEIVSQGFPMKLHVVIRAPKAANNKEFLSWMLYIENTKDNTKLPLTNYEMKATPNTDELHTELTLDKEGSYYFTPVGSDLSNTKSLLNFKIHTTANMENQIKSLINSYDEKPNTGIEVRSK